MRCSWIEALRRLGIAARFVSGYIFIPGDRDPRLCRRRLDPCLGAGVPAERGLDRIPIRQRHRRHPRLIASRSRADPGQAIPLHGTYLGPADAFTHMEVNINVVSVDEAPASMEAEV